MTTRHEAAVLPTGAFGTIDEVLAGLRERGGRATPARRLLLGVLFRDRKHHSVEDLTREVQALSPDINISTIYRNLEEFVRLGVVDRVYFGGGPATYHLAPGGHGHLVCDSCGGVTEVPGEMFGDLAASLALTYGFAADPHQFAVTGRCADCQ